MFEREWERKKEIVLYNRIVYVRERDREDMEEREREKEVGRWIFWFS